MRNDVPAAYPLICFITGLALAPFLVNPIAVLLGVATIAILRRTAPLLFFPLGVLLALQLEARVAREHTTFAQLVPDRFTTVDVPLERDWAERDGSHVLRASRFVANGVAFDTPIAVYTRFEPPNITMEATLRAEGFLRLNDRGEYTLGVKSRALLAYDGELPRWQPRAWNRLLANRLESFERNYANEVAIAQALLLGRGERLTNEMRESFRRGGTYHLLVFSGLQIAFAAAILAILLRWLHAPRASDWLLLAFAALAPLFIGPTASVSRASTGIALYALSRILKRPTSLENLWCVAALLRLILEPRDLTDASFHLTYAGAGALLFVGRKTWTSRAIAAEIAITPLTLFHFNQYTLGGTILTFLMAPLIFAMLVASLLACAFPIALEIVRVLHAVCTALNGFGFSGYFASPPLAALLFGAFGALFALATLRERNRTIALSLALLVPTIAAITRSVSQRSVEHPQVTFFDVGQGDAMALRSGNATLLIDGGRDLRLLPLLADRGMHRIDAIVLSHAHPDHCASLPSIIESFDVQRVFVTPRRFRGDCATKILEACSRASVPIHSLRDGDTIPHGAFTLDVHLADRNFRRAPENNNSVVLRATAQKRTFLFTGDLEKEAELTLADRDLRADVLKVPHHGSKTSTSQTLLDVVAPRLAVISCGRHNLFGHPHAAVTSALEERRIRIWRTDRDGSVEISIQEGRLYVRGGSD